MLSTTQGVSTLGFYVSFAGCLADIDSLAALTPIMMTGVWWWWVTYQLKNKKADLRRLFFLLKWWRRRESNPRPQALRPRRYMLSFVISLTAPTRRTGAELAILWMFSGSGQGSPPSRSCGWCPRSESQAKRIRGRTEL